MPVGAIIGGVGSIVGGIMGSNAAEDAAEAQDKAAKKALALQKEMYDTTRGDLSPYRDVGKSGLYSLADLYGLPTPNNPNGSKAFNEAALEAFRMSPDYEVARREGIGAIDASAAARGNLLSGGQIKRLAEFGADLGARGFGSYMSRLQQLAGMGQSAAAQTGSAGQAYASGGANSLLARGEAQASGIVGSNNALSEGIQGAFDNLSFLAKPPAGGSGGMPNFAEIY